METKELIEIKKSLRFLRQLCVWYQKKVKNEENAPTYRAQMADNISRISTAINRLQADVDKEEEERRLKE